MSRDSSSRLAEGLLAGLSAALGQPLMLDASGQCVLMFEQEVEIVVALAENRLTVRSTLAPWSAAVAADALALNYGELPLGIAVALDRQSSLLVLISAFDADADDADGLIARVAAFVGLVPHLREQLTATDAAPSPVRPAGIRG